MIRFAHRLFCLCALLSLCACVSREVVLLQSFPEPQVVPGQCCWQAQQSIVVEHDGQRFDLLAILAHTEQQFSLAILTPVGQRLLAVTRGNNGVHVERSELIPDDLPISMLSHLVYVSLTGEGRDDYLQGSDWNFQPLGQGRIIRHRSRDIVRMYAGFTEKPVAGDRIEIQHLHIPLNITLVTNEVRDL